MDGLAIKISPGVSTFLKPYCSATRRQPSPSPPTTSTRLSSKELCSSGPFTSSAKGEWLWMMTEASNGTLSFSLISATLSVSCFPPPFVKRIKGIPWSLSNARDSAAPGIGLDDRRSTPSMLGHNMVSEDIRTLRWSRTYSNANAKSGI